MIVPPSPQPPPEPLVSVLVRSMDRPTLQRALDSIAAQDYPRIEIVVVAASGPAHRELPPFAGRVPLQQVRSPRPLARAEAANAAIDAASGQWLNLLDDDDAFLPNHVATLRHALAADPQALLAYARSLSLDERAGTRSEFGAKFKPWRQLDTGFFHSQSALFARALVDAGARFDPRFDILEDMDFFVQCAQRTAPLFVDRITSLSYRDAGTSGTGSSRDEARIAAAIARLRAKWARLEEGLRRSREFRLERMLWLLEQRQARAAQDELGTILAEAPDWPDALAAAALIAAVRGDTGGARSWLDRLGSRLPENDDVQARLPPLRELLRDRG